MDIILLFSCPSDSRQNEDAERILQINYRHDSRRNGDDEGARLAKVLLQHPISTVRSARRLTRPLTPK